MWRRHRESFSAIRVTLAIPLVGALTLVIPFLELCKPGQPAPYSDFPYVALGLVALAGPPQPSSPFIAPPVHGRRGGDGILRRTRHLTVDRRLAG